MGQSMQTHTPEADTIGVLISQMLTCDASVEAKIDWLKFIEPSIAILWHQGKTSVKPVFLMTEDDLVH
jgi:hypothetical protein